MEVHLSSCHPRQASKVPLLVITATYLLEWPTSSFLLSLLSMLRAQFQISPGKVLRLQTNRPSSPRWLHLVMWLLVSVAGSLWWPWSIASWLLKLLSIGDTCYFYSRFIVWHQRWFLRRSGKSNSNMCHGKKESGMFVESHVAATYQDNYNVEVPRQSQPWEMSTMLSVMKEVHTWYWSTLRRVGLQVRGVGLSESSAEKLLP